MGAFPPLSLLMMCSITTIPKYTSEMISTVFGCTFSELTSPE